MRIIILVLVLWLGSGVAWGDKTVKVYTWQDAAEVLSAEAATLRNEIKQLKAKVEMLEYAITDAQKYIMTLLIRSKSPECPAIKRHKIGEQCIVCFEIEK